MGLILTLLTNLPRESAELFGAVIWQLWKEHNSLFWSGSCKLASDIPHAAKMFLQEWNQVQQHKEISVNRHACQAWHAPPLGYLKVNIDAAFFEDSNHIGLGMVIRDSNGSFVVGRTLILDGCVDVDVSETMGFLEVLSWVKNLGLQNLIVGGDSKCTVDAIAGSRASIYSFGDIVSQYRVLLSELCNVSI